MYGRFMISVKLPNDIEKRLEAYLMRQAEPKPITLKKRCLLILKA